MREMSGVPVAVWSGHLASPMIGSNVVVAGCALVLAVAVGLVAHEWTHAVGLRLARVEYSVSYFPGRADGLVALLTTTPGLPSLLVRPAANPRGRFGSRRWPRSSSRSPSSDWPLRGT